MTQTIIELYYDTDSNGELILAGDPEYTSYEKIKPHLTAIEHNMNNGIDSTLYKVADDAPASVIEEVRDMAQDNADHGMHDGILRGLEIQPGTPSESDVDGMNAFLKDIPGIDLANEKPQTAPSSHVWHDLPDDNVGGGPPSWAGPPDNPGAGRRGRPDGSGGNGNGGGNNPNAGRGNTPNKTWEQILKNDMPTIGSFQWMCTHPDHGQPEVNDNQEQTCSLGHSRNVAQNLYASQNRKPFNAGADGADLF